MIKKEKHLKIVERDPYLQPYEGALQARADYAKNKEAELTGGQPLAEWASGYLFFGLHKTAKNWILREWAPNATAIYIKGDMNNWTKDENYRLQSIGNGVWEAKLPLSAMQHGQMYKLLVEWQGGYGERIPSYVRRVVQDEQTKIFSAQVWDEPEFQWKNRAKKHSDKSGLFIYECHIGMSSEQEKVNSYEEFRRDVLPRIAELGYNCIQIMAIQEHPYYGSFGYHVSNFFAASSRFGTPNELKALIDDAHGRGMYVIMDLVHSHAVKNELEGLGNFDGTPYQYFHDGGRREHPAWDSLCFNYGKNEVLHFLLSNCKFWLDEYDFDGFRFDGKSFKVLADYKQSLNMKMHQGIHPQYYGKMVERLVERMGTNKEIRNKFAEKLKEIEKEENGKWVHERILFSKDSEKKEKNSNVTYAAYLNLFGKKDVKSGKITLIYTTVSTTFKMKKMLFVHKKDEDTIERRDIDMKPDEIDENDVKVIMGYGDKN